MKRWKMLVGTALGVAMLFAGCSADEPSALAPQTAIEDGSQHES